MLTAERRAAACTDTSEDEAVCLLLERREDALFCSVVLFCFLRRCIWETVFLYREKTLYSGCTFTFSVDWAKLFETSQNWPDRSRSPGVNTPLLRSVPVRTVILVCLSPARGEWGQTDSEASFCPLCFFCFVCIILSSGRICIDLSISELQQRSHLRRLSQSSISTCS